MGHTVDPHRPRRPVGHEQRYLLVRPGRTAIHLNWLRSHTSHTHAEDKEQRCNRRAADRSKTTIENPHCDPVHGELLITSPAGAPPPNRGFSGKIGFRHTHLSLAILGRRRALRAKAERRDSFRAAACFAQRAGEVGQGLLQPFPQELVEEKV